MVDAWKLKRYNVWVCLICLFYGDMLAIVVYDLDSEFYFNGPNNMLHSFFIYIPLSYKDSKRRVWHF